MHRIIWEKTKLPCSWRSPRRPFFKSLHWAESRGMKFPQFEEPAHEEICFPWQAFAPACIDERVVTHLRLDTKQPFWDHSASTERFQKYSDKLAGSAGLSFTESKIATASFWKVFHQCIIRSLQRLLQFSRWQGAMLGSTPASSIFESQCSASSVSPRLARAWMTVA